jgi:hypothetical protein
MIILVSLTTSFMESSYSHTMCTGVRGTKEIQILGMPQCIFSCSNIPLPAIENLSIVSRCFIAVTFDNAHNKILSKTQDPRPRPQNRTELLSKLVFVLVLNRERHAEFEDYLQTEEAVANERASKYSNTCNRMSPDSFNRSVTIPQTIQVSRAKALIAMTFSHAVLHPDLFYLTSCNITFSEHPENLCWKDTCDWTEARDRSTFVFPRQ